MKHIISTEDLEKKIVEEILLRAENMEQACKEGKIEKLLKDKIIACIFFEPSTRTRLSFETAALKLGAQVISVENAMTNSTAYKGETVEDSTRMLSIYADVIVMRHSIMGTAERAVSVATKPVINAGDGANQHPSQGLLDLYTIKKEFGKLENLNITFVGDLLYSRTLKSLMPLLILYPNNKFTFVSPRELELPREYIEELKAKGAKIEESNDLGEALKNADVLYMTRVQKERFTNIEDYNKVRDLFLLKVEHLKEMKKDAIIMHPLPRVNEIDPQIDADPRAAYFRQAENGLYVRMALLCYVLGL